MRKNIFLLLFGLFIFAFARSQQLSPNVIAPDGGISKARGISLEWTLGETSIESLSTSDRIYTQGFHQPLLLAKSFQPIAEITLAGYQVTIAPNPVQSMLTVNLTSLNNEKVYLTLIDFTGRRLPAQVAWGTGTAKVNMGGMVSGIYLLEIRNASNQLVKSFKIIKGQ